MAEKKGLNKAKARQIDAHKPQHEAYRRRDARNINKCKRMVKHLKRYPHDAATLGRLNSMPILSRANSGALDFIKSKLPELQAARS